MCVCVYLYLTTKVGEPVGLHTQIEIPTIQSVEVKIHIYTLFLKGSKYIYTLFSPQRQSKYSQNPFITHTHTHTLMTP